MNINPEILKSAIGWDLSNWSRALDFWSSYCSFTNKIVLELGCGCDNGGLSLWAASLGAKKVICSDYSLPHDVTVSIHKKYYFDSIIESL